MASRRSSLPPQVIAARLAACRLRIQQKKVGGYLISNRADQFYFTGFDGEDGAALILPEQVYLLTDERFKDEVKVDAPWARAVIRKKAIKDAVLELVRRHRIRRLGFQPDILTVAGHKALRKALKKTNLVPMPPVPSELREIKDAGEVAAIEKAIAVAESAFTAAVRRVRIGMTEQEFAASLEYELLRRGASGPSFPIIIAEGANAAFPHAKPGQRRFRAGSAVLVDWGATVDHYRSDLTRVMFIRRIPARFRRMYNMVLAAQGAAIDAIRPGARMCDIDAKARGVLTRAGMGKQFSHSTGHGLGLDIHEAPRLGRRIKEPLKPGMVVTVEPGVYFPGVGGVRIEDDVLVTENGHRVLSRLSKDINDMVV